MRDHTLCILKPDAVHRGIVPAILARLQDLGFVIRAMRMHRLTKPEAITLYAEHAGKPFFARNLKFMTTYGPSVLLLLDTDLTKPPNAVWTLLEHKRALRELFAQQYGPDEMPEPAHNVLHASDSLEAARRETAFFFPGAEYASLWGLPDAER